MTLIDEHREAIRYVDNHIKNNCTSSDLPMWYKALRKLKKRLEELEECLHLGEYDE